VTAPGARRTIELLLVEDNPGDVHLILEALKDARIDSRVHIVEDGEAALRFLRREGEHTQASRPHLILLDLNRPRKDGHEVLAELRSDPAIKSIPVVVLTSSERSSDIVTSYELHANCYITKPTSVEDFLDVVRSISDFWFDVVALPASASG
jgi:chemotaxis family two-component system response regulator Rcp1